jgi:hypothetical protein
LKEASFWSHLLYDLGPFALIVFFALVTLPISRRELANRPSSRVHETIYSVNWMFVFILGVVLTAVWIYLHVWRAAELHGEIRNLPDRFVVSNDKDSQIDLFTQRRDSKHGLTFYNWLALSTHPLEVGSTVPIVIYDGTNDKASGSELKLIVQKVSYDQGVIIEYHPQKHKFSLLQGDKSTDLEVENLDSSDSTSNLGPDYFPRQFSILPIVHAEPQQDMATISVRLDSPDPITRRDARHELAQNESASLSFIDSVLSDPTSTYRLKLGVIVALNLMPAVPLEASLSVPSLVFILRSIGSEDSNLRNEARKFLQKKGNPAIEKKIRASLESPDPSTKQVFPQQRTDTALADMDLLYNLGISEKDLYRTPKDQAHIAVAIDDFAAAWGVRKYATESSRIYFAKALYGWALTLADRSVVDQDSNGRKKPELTAAAQEKFKEFVQAAETPAGGRSYPAQDKIAQAKRFLTTGSL